MFLVGFLKPSKYCHQRLKSTKNRAMTNAWFNVDSITIPLAIEMKNIHSKAHSNKKNNYEIHEFKRLLCK